MPDPSTHLRRDVAKNRVRILAAARELRAAGHPLQLNAVAARAQVGVGTVYRHFPSVGALAESLTFDRFETLTVRARAATGDEGAGPALRAFLHEALTVYVEDDLFAAVATAASPELGETRDRRSELLDAVGELVGRVESSASLRPPLTAGDALALLCGVAYSARIVGPDAPSRRAAIYLDALLDGMLAEPNAS